MTIDWQLLIPVFIAVAGFLIVFWPKLSRSTALIFNSNSGASGTILKNFTRDLTEEARQGRLDPVIGREKEISRIVNILNRRTKNNPLMIGPPGVGKTAVLEGLARLIVENKVPENLKNKRVLALDLNGLISGTKYRGEFEERIKKMLDEIVRAHRNIILFIDELHMIITAKGAEGSLNISDIIKPTLARGELQAIGATTLQEYKKYIMPDDSLNRRFQLVLVGEPSQEDAIDIIRGIKEIYENYHQVKFTDDAIEAAVILSHRYIKDRFLPDKAIDLIDEAGSKVAIEMAHNVPAIGILFHAAKKVNIRCSPGNLKKIELEIDEENRKIPLLEGSQRKSVEKNITQLRACLSEAKNRKPTPESWPLVLANDIKEIVSEWVNLPIDQI